MDRRLVDHLVNSSIVSRAAMQRMILRASKDKTSLIDQLLADGKVDEDAVARELADYYGLDLVGSDFGVNEMALKFISKEMADKHGVLPFAISASADHVTVAVYNPETAKSVVDTLKTATGREPTVMVAARTWLSQAIRHYYFGEPWAEAPSHNVQTREVADVANELGALGMEESSEIVLDEVVVPPVPKPRARGEETPIPSPPEDVVDEDESPLPPPEPRRRKSRGGKTTPAPTRSDSKNGIDPDSEVDQALDEFDAFLDNATGWGNRSGSSGIPGWDDDIQDDNPFSLRATAAGWDKPSPDDGGFSLFDDGPESSPQVQATLDEHEKLIERLRREIQQQREIITALVDALAEAGVVSKREIKHRVKRK